MTSSASDTASGERTFRSLRRPAADYTLLVYSDDAATRERIRFAIGRRPAPDLGTVDFVEAATMEEVLATVDRGGVDAIVLDGEAWPTGGAGISRQLKNELRECPPVCLIVARKDDIWLANWSLADTVLAHPLNPLTTATAIAELLRNGGTVAAQSTTSHP